MSCFFVMLVVSWACLATQSLAAPFDNRPKLMLHLIPVTTKNICARGLIDCQAGATAGSLVDSESGPFYIVYLLAELGSIASSTGFACGLHYGNDSPNADRDGRGIEVFDWRLCGSGYDLPSNPPWPKPTGVSSRVWYSDMDDCLSDRAAVSGYFYLGAYSPDTLRLGLRQFDNPPVMINCQTGLEQGLSPGDLGSVVFSAGGTISGCNPCVVPCGVIATTSTTWSRIKGTLLPQTGDE
ncbi:MAG: hypothetical protein SGI90_04050 [Candidatus Eisenbacteria bacterium]|nr:hypothetical protein [Candidatus Eisenbacteria bacterium]